MKTWVSDNFPLSELECQYLDICRDYHPVTDKQRVCAYDYPCELRNWFREVTESYISKENLKLQINLIVDEYGKKKKNKD